jgi:hypothetical protein
MLEHYQELVSSGEPVHAWSIETAQRPRR